MKIEEYIKNTSKSPGVYFWIDKSENVLYVGRATNLNTRLKQYLSKDVDPKTKEMRSLACKIKTIECDTLLEAIILEAKYIKQYWPKYNIREKDDRSFIYIVIEKKAFSQPLVIRARELELYPESKYHVFGPYQSYALIKQALKIIRRIFPYSLCDINSKKACFDYQIGLCPGACIGQISEQEYQNNINNIILLLKGSKKRLINKLSKENPAQKQALLHLQDVALFNKEKDLSDLFFNRIEAYDISHFAGKESYGSMVVFDRDKSFNKQEYRLFKIQNRYSADDMKALEEVLLRRFKHTEWTYPDLVLIDGGKPQLQFLETVLKKYKIKNVVGLSKFQGDKLIFLDSLKSSNKKEVQKNKEILVQLRDEAHRFANNARKKSFKKRV